MKPIQCIVGLVLLIISMIIFHDPDGPHFQSSAEIIGSIISPILFVIGCIVIVMSFGKEDKS